MPAGITWRGDGKGDVELLPSPDLPVLGEICDNCSKCGHWAKILVKIKDRDNR